MVEKPGAPPKRMPFEGSVAQLCCDMSGILKNLQTEMQEAMVREVLKPMPWGASEAVSQKIYHEHSLRYTQTGLGRVPM
jgi:hypothetical protein